LFFQSEIRLETTAAQQSDGLAVAGFFLQVSDKTNDNYVPVINGLIKLAGQPDNFDVDIGSLPLRSLLPTPGAADHLHYYKYFRRTAEYDQRSERRKQSTSQRQL